jgi:hypothetical protein
VAARVLDVLLQSDSAAFLQRLGLSLMTALAPALLALDDFEALITHMKVRGVGGCVCVAMEAQRWGTCSVCKEPVGVC